ncbi:MAG: SDR family NAD(P)-dependent oxidoreductase [Maritimibacter sp.]
MAWSREDIAALSGRRAVVTGTSGLCVEILRGLCGAGAEVIMAGRSAERAQFVMDEIKADYPAADISFREVDLASLASVRAFCEVLRGEAVPVSILVLNAAVMAELKRRETVDGFEMMFGVNHLAHFAMVLGVLPLLREGRARVVSLSSGAHKYGALDFDNLNAQGKVKPMLAYGRTKLACMMFANELDRLSAAHDLGITSLSAHPGFARTKGVYDRLSTLPVIGWIAARTVVPLMSHAPDKAALPILYAAIAPDARGGGNYGPTGWREMVGPVGDASTAPYARDAQANARLWQVSEALTGCSLKQAMGMGGALG